MEQSSLRYAKSHEWVAVENGVATVGITQFAVDQLTDVTYLELPSVGKVAAVGDELGIIESVKSTSSIYAPVAGKVVAVNEAVAKDTSLINSDPFGTGWLLKIELAPGAGVDHLLTHQQYGAQIAGA